MTKKTIFSAITLALILSSCDPAPPEKPAASPQDVFFERLSLLCGKAYSGSLVTSDPLDAAMATQPMIMHVTNCKLNEVQIPFHIGETDDKWNRSRTWIVTRTEGGLRLKHQHLHEDGKPDAVTNYGGDTANESTAERQEFPVDEESITSFKANDLDQSVTNTWAMEISPPGKRDAQFAYELRRPESADNRHFRVEFDLSKPVETPPPAWGN